MWAGALQQIFASVAPATHDHVWLSNWRSTLHSILWVCQKMCEALPDRGRVHVSSHTSPPDKETLCSGFVELPQGGKDRVKYLTKQLHKRRLHKYFLCLLDWWRFNYCIFCFICHLFVEWDNLFFLVSFMVKLPDCRHEVPVFRSAALSQQHILLFSSGKFSGCKIS